MFNTLKKRIKNEKGLSLIELLAVIVIMAIIAAIAIPAIGNIINNSRDKAVLTEASNILAGAKLAHVDNKCTLVAAGGATCSDAQLKGFVDGIDVTATATKATATLSAAGVWSVDYAKISTIKNANYKPATGTSITETQINENLAK